MRDRRSTIASRQCTRNTAFHTHRSRTGLLRSPGEGASRRQLIWATSNGYLSAVQWIKKKIDKWLNEIANTSGDGLATVEWIIYGCWMVSNVCGTFIPRMLPGAEGKPDPCSEENLELMKENLNWFKQRLVTRDEMWIHHYNFWSKGTIQTVETQELFAIQQDQISAAAGKIVSVFIPPHKVTITAANCLDFLHRLRNAIKKTPEECWVAVLRELLGGCSSGTQRARELWNTIHCCLSFGNS